jgi:hypothetical protein
VPYRLSHGVLTWTFDPGREVHLSISDHVPLPLSGFLYLDGFDCGLDECLTCCLDSCHSLARDGVRSLGLTHGRCPHDIVDRYLLKTSLDPWTRAVDLAGLQVVVSGSSEVPLWMLHIS